MQLPNISIRASWGPVLPRRATQGGFTLIEILIAMAIFLLLVGLGLFMSMDAYRGYSFRSERDVVVSLLQKARSRSMANIHQSAWGVCTINSTYIVFRGTACVAGAATNETLPVSSSATVAGLLSPGVVFSQLGGTTTATTVTVTEGTRVSTISINHEGTINW